MSKLLRNREPRARTSTPSSITKFHLTASPSALPLPSPSRPLHNVMAATMTSTSPTPITTTRPNPSRTPLPLSASQESQVRELYHKRVRQKCADEVREFATCCLNRTFTATLFCRPQQKAMNQCMMRFATQEEQDAARAEWFAKFDERKAERERREEQRRKDEVFWREWWDKDLSKKPGESLKEGDGK